MPTASPYLLSALTRWTDRQKAVRTEVESHLDHTAEKRVYLDDLMKQVLRHRHEDVSQLAESHEAAASRWQERLKRLETWVDGAVSMRQRFDRVQGWQRSVRWFERMNRLAERAALRLERRARRYEERHTKISEELSLWNARLGMKEVELREFVDRQTHSAYEIFVSSARKKPFLDFVVEERDHESQLGKTLRSLREGVMLTLKRLETAITWAKDRAGYQPAKFELHRKQIELLSEPLRGRYETIRIHVMNDALLFEEGRKRLRDVYEMVQKMRVIESPQKPARTFFDRLLNYEKE